MPCVVNPNHLVLLDGVVSRITDRQGYQATERWTRNLAEQARLEALITRVKPPLPVDWPQADAGRSLPDHRLLLTPFRDPPLVNGSRFSGADARELFYAARSLATVLAERAFHALRLLEGSPLPEGRCIHRQQTSFSVQSHTERGLRLQHCLDEQTLAAVVDPCSYAASQALGREMRQLLPCPWRWMRSIHGKIPPLQQLRRSSSALVHCWFSRDGVSRPRFGNHKLTQLSWTSEAPRSLSKASRDDLKPF